MTWKDDFARKPLWTAQEIEDLLCGNKPDASRPETPKKKSANEDIHRAVRAGLLNPVDDTPNTPAYRLYGPGDYFFPKANLNRKHLNLLSQ